MCSKICCKINSALIYIVVKTNLCRFKANLCLCIVTVCAGHFPWFYSRWFCLFPRAQISQCWLCCVKRPEWVGEWVWSWICCPHIHGGCGFTSLAFPFPWREGERIGRKPGCCEEEKHKKAAEGCGKLLSAEGLQLKLIVGWFNWSHWLTYCCCREDDALVQQLWLFLFSS